MLYKLIDINVVTDQPVGQKVDPDLLFIYAV